MVWLHVVELFCASVAVQVRCVLLTSLPLTGRLASTNVTVRLVSQVSLNTGVPNTTAAGHWMLASAGQLTTAGLVLSSTVMVWLQLAELFCASVAVQVRCVLLTSLPLTGRLASTNVTVRLVSQVSLNTGAPNTTAAGHSMLASAGQLTTAGLALSSTVMVWLHVAELFCASVAVQVRCVLLTSLPLTGRLASTNVTVRLVSQVSLNTGVPNTAAAGHWMLASAGQLTTVGTVLSSTVMVWLQLAELFCASVAVQVRCVLLTSLPLTGRLASTNVTVRLVSQVSLNTGAPNTTAAGHWMLASAGQLTTAGPVLSSTVMVWLHVAELFCASVAVQVRCVLLTSLPLTGRLASTNVTVRLVSQVSLNTGAPNTTAAGHWMLASAGQLTTAGPVLSSTVIVWLHVAELFCASVAVQVRCVLLTSLPLTGRLASTNVTVRLVSQVSLNTGAPNTTAAGHWMLASAGQLTTTGLVLSSTLMVWLHVAELFCASVAVQVRCVLLTSLPLTGRLASTNVTVRLVSQVSLTTGSPNTTAAGHWMLASAGQLTTVGTVLSSTVMVWLHVVELFCASVAVHVRCVLLTSLPLTGRLASTKVTVRLVSQVSLNTGVPNTTAAGHSMVASAGQLTTTGLVLSSTVMVWLHVVELFCASVAVQVRCVLLTSLPLTGRLASTNVTRSVERRVAMESG